MSPPYIYHYIRALAYCFRGCFMLYCGRAGTLLLHRFLPFYEGQFSYWLPQRGFVSLSYRPALQVSGKKAPGVILFLMAGCFSFI